MKIKITELKNNPANPRNITEKEFNKLITSLLVFPEMLSTRPMIINASHEVLGGNQRLRALLAISQMEEAEISQRITNSSDGKKMKKEEREECIRHWVAFTDHQEVEVEMVHWSDHQQRQFIIKDNATFGEWDWDKLANEWDSDELNDWGVGVWAESDKDNQEVEEDDFSLDGIDDTDDSEAVTKLGDVWQLGRHRLVCGDCTDEEAVNKLMNGEKADMVFTDPPYGMKKEADGVLNDNLNYDDLLEFNKKWIPLTFANTKDNGSWYCWGTDLVLFDIYHEIIKPKLKTRELSFLNYIVWDKGCAQGQMNESLTKYATATERCLFVCKGANNASSGCFRTKDFYFEGFESIRGYMCDELRKAGLTIRDAIKATSSYASHYFAKSQWAFPTEDDYNKIKAISNRNAFKKEYKELQKEYKELQKEYKELLPYFNNTHDNQNDVWHFKVTSPNERELAGEHPTPKPIALCARAIKSSSRENGIVLDVFGGSGSTLIACEQLNRTCYMMELSPKYCDVIIKRYEALTGEKAVKISN